MHTSRYFSLVTVIALAACAANAPTSATSGGTDDGTGVGVTSSGADATSSTTSSTSSGTTIGDPTTSSSTGVVDSTGSTGSGSESTLDAGWLECDAWSQICPEGHKCIPYSSDGDGTWDSLKCVPVDPNPGKVGDPCTHEGAVSGVDTCDVGAMCWNVDDVTMEGTCVALCTGSPDVPMCPDGTTCSIYNGGVLILCLTVCDPLAQDCSAGDTCIADPVEPDVFICVVDDSGDGGHEHDACKYANACDPGLFCANSALDDQCDPMASGCCLAFCDLTNSQCSSPDPVQCVPWFEPDLAPPGYEDVGVCIIPP